MPRQILITGIACLIAAGVLVATILFSPALPDPDEPIDLTLPDPKRFAPHDPKAITDANQAKQAGTIRKYFVRHWNEKKKQLTIFAGDSITPKPNGVAEVVGLSAQIHLVPGKKVIVIQGKEGTIVAPNNNVESGEIRNGVVVSFYATGEDRNVDLSTNSKDVGARLFLDEAVRFDLELGTLESDGPVYGTSAFGEYRGRGVNLILNERQKRINQFIIHHGKELRFKVKDRNKEKLLGSPKPPDASHADRVATFYRIAFSEDVDVTVPDAKVNAKTLAILVAAIEKSDSKGIFGNFDSPAKTAATETNQAADPKHVPDLAVGGRPTRSLFTPDPDDWIVKWSGTMRVDPLDERPAELTGIEDRLVEMTAAHIQTTDGEQIKAERLDYRTSDARVRMFGSDEQPLVIESDKLGQLNARQFVMLQKQGTAKIVGPGMMVTRAKPNAATIVADGKPLPIDSGKVPTDMTVRWTKGVDLAFFIKTTKATGENEPAATDSASTGASLLGAKKLGQLEALKSATFHGAVDVKHKQFDLAAETLGVTMAEPVGKARHSEPHRILARGNVNATARGSSKQPPINIKAGEFAVTFKPDAIGKARPSRFIALNNVRTSQPGRRMRAETLDVELKPVPKGDPNNGATDTNVAMRTIRADKNVFIELDAPLTRVNAEKLLADIESGTLDLHGTDGIPAAIMREDNLLTGKHILLREKDRFVRVNGPGSAVLLAGHDAINALNTAARPANTQTVQLASTDTNVGPRLNDAKPAQKKKSREPQRVKISWIDGMEFNDVLGHAKFMGQVVATSDRRTDVTRFQAGELEIELTPGTKGSDKGFGELLTTDANRKAQPDNQPDKQPGDQAGKNAEPNVNQEQDVAPKKKSPQRVIQRMVARHKVVFDAEKWADRVGGKLDTRFRLRGPKLTFNQKTEIIAVDGKGTMQIEDYREKTEKDAKATPEKSSNRSVAFVGQGVTFFSWDGGMKLDAKKNDLAIHDGVQLLQLEKGSQKQMQMDCKILNANFASTGGLTTWLSGNPPEPDLENVIADGGVRVIHEDKTISGHRLEYKGQKQMVVLTERDGYLCTLDDAETSLPAKSFKWYLETDKVVAIEPGAVRARIKDN